MSLEVSNKGCRRFYTQSAMSGGCSCPEGRCWYSEQKDSALPMSFLEWKRNLSLPAFVIVARGRENRGQEALWMVVRTQEGRSRILGRELTREEAQELAKTEAGDLPLRDWNDCVVCGGKWPEAFMVHDKDWDGAGLGRGIIHIGCLQKTLGRKLTAADFDLTIPINAVLAEGIQIGERDFGQELMGYTINEGREAALKGEPRSSNPYTTADESKRIVWDAGWIYVSGLPKVDAGLVKRMREIQLKIDENLGPIDPDLSLYEQIKDQRDEAFKILKHISELASQKDGWSERLEALLKKAPA